MNTQEYINNWIDAANALFQEHDKKLLDLGSWKFGVEKNGYLEKFPSLIADVEHLKHLDIDTSTVDLSKLASITGLFTFNADDEVTEADIVPGDLVDTEEHLEPGQIPVKIGLVWYNWNEEDEAYYVSDKYGNLTDEPAPDELVEAIDAAWEIANEEPEPEIDPETGEPVVDPFADSGGIDKDTRLAVTTGTFKHIKGATKFTGKKNQYLSGVGTFEDMPELENLTVVPVTRAELLTLIAEKELMPNSWYRITDYQTIILSDKARSVKTAVDIFALAMGTDILSENVLFSQHEDDTYFNGSSVRAWTGKYSIYNDVTRFNFLNAYKTLIVVGYNSGSSDTFTTYVRYENSDFTNSGVKYYAWKPLTCSVIEFKEFIEPFIAAGVTPYSGQFPYDTEKSVVYTKDEIPEVNAVSDAGYGYYSYPYGYGGTYNSSPIYNSSRNAIPTASIREVYPVSKGVIYSLTDEFGNSAPYDFKSIQFEWLDDEVCGFTFSKYSGDNYYDAADASIMNTIPIYRNVIGEVYEAFTDRNSQEYQRLSLNKILHASTCVENSYGIGCADMYILGECRNNRWLGNSGSNKFKSSVIGNYFYPEVNNNLFEIAVSGNLIMEYFTDNSFTIPTHTTEQSFDGQVPTFEFSHNTIGTNFNNNTFTVPRIVGNVFGKDASYNTFVGTVASWTTNYNTFPNTLFTEDRLNLIGLTAKNNFTRNTIEGGIHNTTIGNNFINNSITRYLENSNLMDQVQECNIDASKEIVFGGNNTKVALPSSTTTTIDYGCSYIKFSFKGGQSVIKNVHVHRGVEGLANSIKALRYDSTDSTVKVKDYISSNNQEISVS